MQKRIYGLETEYGIIFTPEGRKTLPVEKAIRFLFEKLITTEHFLNVFLENGARFYQDTGCHPEYATPECASPRDLVIFDRAGSLFQGPFSGRIGQNRRPVANSLLARAIRHLYTAPS